MADTKAPQGKRKPPLDPASESWNGLPWRKLEQHVYRIQKRMCAMRRIEISLV
jgi:RNA-directed DNA polymerase